MQIEKNDLYNRMMEELRKETTQITFNTWLKDLEIISIDDSHVVFESKSDYQKEMVETRYKDLILNTLQFITNMNCTFSVVSKESEENTTSEEELTNEDSASNDSDGTETITYNNSSLNPKYTFDTFVVVSYNRFAHAAALAVGEKPYVAYNPKSILCFIPIVSELRFEPSPSPLTLFVI